MPRGVVPKHYAITLRPDMVGLTFTGSETIEIEVLHPTREIVLNALDLSVSNPHLVDTASAPHIVLDFKKQTVSLRFPSRVRVGRHKLHLEFSGKINASAQGLFYTRYQTPTGHQKVMLCTQMEPTDARRVFPVWDEPGYRSSFELTAEVPEAFSAISNMPGDVEQTPGQGIKRVHFAPTPNMASYLAVFCAGEVEAISEKVNGIDVRVVTTEGKRENGRYAMDALKKLLPYYQNYFGVAYPLPKLDLIAVPGVIRGGMENWGGITFNESVLLFDSQRSSQRTKEHIFSLIAHEVAHQWFGNLVTMEWWDDLWLNEGFATWMQTKATDHFNPTWQMWPRADRAKQEAMDIDARRTTHPIRQAVTDSAEAARAFDPITYAKAGAIIRMIETYLGEETFRSGVRRYMEKHQFQNTVSGHLWKALQDTSGQPVGTMASTWIEQPGLPIIRMQSHCRDGQKVLAFKQERFTINDPAAEPLRWSIPLTFRNEFTDRSAQTYLLSNPSGEVGIRGCADPVKLNAGNTGYYRVQYAPADNAALLDRFSQLAPQDRLNLLSDAWALVLGNRGDASVYLALAERITAADDIGIWEQAFATLRELDRLQIAQPGRSEFRNVARSLLRPLYDRLGWDAKPNEAETDAHLRTSLLSLLGRLGDVTIINEARRRFADFLSEETSLAPDLRPVVSDVVGRYADQRAYDQLHNLARSATSVEQKHLLYGAMSIASSPALAGQTLALALTDELEPSLAASLVPKVAFEGEHGEMAWAFLKNHLNPLLAKVSLFGRYRYVTYVVQGFNETTQARELNAFARKHLPNDALPEIRKAVERIEFRHLLRQRELPKIDAWICRHRQGNEASDAQRCQ